MWSEFAVWLLLLGCSQTDFKQQLEHFNKDLFTLVAWDPRGYGKSIPPTRDWPEQFFRRDADDAAKLMEVCSSTFLNQITFATTNRLCISISVTNFFVYLGHPLAWGALWTLCIDYCNCLLIYWLECLGISSRSCRQWWTAHNDSSVDGISLITSVACCVIGFIGCLLNRGYNTNSV